MNLSPRLITQSPHKLLPSVLASGKWIGRRGLFGRRLHLGPAASAAVAAHPVLQAFQLRVPRATHGVALEPLGVIDVPFATRADNEQVGLVPDQVGQAVEPSIRRHVKGGGLSAARPALWLHYRECG